MDRDSVERLCSPNTMPELDLANENLICDREHKGLSSDEASNTRVVVNHLTTSWTNVKR